MPLDPVTQLILGLPIGVAANISTDLFNNLLRRLNQRSMEKMFFDTFIKIMESENKVLDGFLKKIVKQAKSNKKNIMGIFAAGIKIKDMSNVSEVFKLMETEGYRKQVAQEMVKIFSIDPKFQETIEVIIKQCLENYKQVFLNSLTTEEGVRLLVAQQFRNDENLLEIQKGIVVELNKKIEKTATKEDLNKGFEDLKKFIKPSKDQIQWEELKELIPELQDRLIHKKTGENNFTPLFLGKLLGYLDQSQCRLLNVLSIYRISVPKEAVMAHDITIVRKDRKKLEDLSLLEYMKEKGLYYVHRLTAQYVLGLMEADVRKQYHCQAGEYFEGIKDEEGKSYVEYYIESRWHFLQAGEWDRAAKITFDLESFLTLFGYTQMSFELLKEFEDKPLNDKNRSIALHQMGMLYQFLVIMRRH